MGFYTAEEDNMRNVIPGYILFTVLGYLSGSILFGKVFSGLMKGIDLTAVSDDGNPGTFNAFRYGGTMCGIFTLLADLLKGYLPVTACRSFLGSGCLLFAFVMAAPVYGHAFSVFYHGEGGKAIAVSFGVLLGLLPNVFPLLALAGFYLFFSLVIRLTPHAKRSICAFLGLILSCILFEKRRSILLGCIMLAGTVIYKHCVPFIYHDTRTDV